MTQLNLLPDIKLEYLRTNRNKRLVIGVSLIVIASSIGILLLLGSIVYVFQKKNLSDLNADITTYNNQLKNTPDLDKVLTIQNQLNALTGLHEGKPVASRLTSFLTQLTPTTVSITQLDADFVENSLSITGSAESLDFVNTYADTFKFTTYQAVDAQGTAAGDGTKAFSNVVLSQFSRDSDGADYTITLNFDPLIFKNTSEIKLTVPKIVSTRSMTEQPTDLFESPQENQ